MKIGIVGFPGCGKSTVFTALSGITASAGRGVRLGTVKVPDARVDRLSRLYEPRKTTYAEVVFADLPGSGAGEQGLSPALLGQMRDMDVLAQVLRGFAGAAGESPDPLGELDALETELQVADLDLIERRLARLAKGDRSERPGEKVLLERLKAGLEQGIPARLLEVSEGERATLTGMILLSLKPVLYLLNVDEQSARAPAPAELAARVEQAGGQLIVLAAAIEAEIAALEPEDRAAFLADLGLESSARDRFVAAAYARLDLISFFTVGKDEVRAWTIHRGMNAAEAAGRIHSDLQRGFIRADVTAYSELVAREGDEAACRKAGVTRKEGKTYVVQDGDVINVHFNV